MCIILNTCFSFIVVHYNSCLDLTLLLEHMVYILYMHACTHTHTHTQPSGKDQLWLGMDEFLQGPCQSEVRDDVTGERRGLPAGQ